MRGRNCARASVSALAVPSGAMNSRPDEPALVPYICEVSEKMLSGEKILVTGAAGQIAFPIARELRADNEVWGLARFSKPEDRQRLVDVGIVPVKGDVAAVSSPTCRPTSHMLCIWRRIRLRAGTTTLLCVTTPKAPGCCFSTAGMYVEHW